MNTSFINHIINRSILFKNIHTVEITNIYIYILSFFHVQLKNGLLDSLTVIG